MSQSFTSPRARARSKVTATKHAARRFLLMAMLGLFIKNGELQAFGGRGFDLATLRLPSVLGRLGAAYFLAALALIWLPSRPERAWEGTAGRLPEVTDFVAAWCAVGFLTLGYLGLTFLYPVPGCPIGYIGPGGLDCGSYSKNWGSVGACDGTPGGCNASALAAGMLAPGCALSHCTAGFMGYFDMLVLGKQHLTSQGRHGSMCAEKYLCVDFDDNGPFGVLPTTFHVFLGFTAGRALSTAMRPRAPRSAVLRLPIWGIVFCSAGLLLDLTGAIPLSKNLWSLSFCLWTSGLACLGLTVLFLLIDDERRPCWHWFSGGSVHEYPHIALAFKVTLTAVVPCSRIMRMLGQNSLGLYVISELVDSVLGAFCWSATGHCDESSSFSGSYKHFLLHHVAGGDDNTGIALWAASNLLIICLVAVYFEISGIIIKL
eukprot:SAG31_NODE_5049_length_2776_cov_8.966754_2_plen_430_part_00